MTTSTKTTEKYSRIYFSICIPAEKNVSQVLDEVLIRFGGSEDTVLIHYDKNTHELLLFLDPGIDIQSLSLAPLTNCNSSHHDNSEHHIVMVIHQGNASLSKTDETTNSKNERLLRDLSKGLSKRYIKSLKDMHTCNTHLAYTPVIPKRKRTGNTIPVPAEPDHPAKKQKLENDENVLSLTDYRRMQGSAVKENKKPYSVKGKKLKKPEATVTGPTPDNNARDDKAPFRDVTNNGPQNPTTSVANQDQQKMEVEKKKTSFVKQVKKVCINHLRKVCNKVKKKYAKKLQSKKITKVLRKLTALPETIQHNVTVKAFPAKRSGKSGRNRNQNSSSSRPTNGVPIQASDSTERDRNRPLVTSTTPVFSTGGPGPPTNPIPTTNLMDLDNERILRDRLRGVGNTVQVAPRYPEYADQTVRQRSFANWPSYTQQQAARLIIFGFYYTGQADLVRCFQCGIGLKDWSPGDEPLFEHVRHSPNCPFLQQLLGDELLGTYRDNLAEAQQRNETATSHGLNIQAPQTRARIVRHPDRATMRQRLDTFNGWPHTNGQPPQRLAEAGLFYTGTNDLCRCFTCDGGLQRWDKDDDPWLEHARWFPHCTYVREVKGQDYINLVLAAAEQAMREDEESVVIQGLQSTDLQTTDPMSTAEARSVIEMGYSKTAVQLAIHEYNGKNPTKGALSFSAADLVQILVGRQERGEEIPQDLPSEELGASGSSQQAATADPMVENKRLKHILKCLKCQENDCNMLLLPCTHHRLCEECAQNVTHCPVCGRKVEDKVKTFMS